MSADPLRRLSALSILTLAGSASAAAPPPLLGGRYLTFIGLIRVNQIEVTRTQNLGHDEAALHTPDAVRAMREHLQQAFPGARMTWAFSWLALGDPRPNYQAIRRLVVQYHQELGDEITFIPGAYFSPMHNTREQTNRDLHDGLARVSAMVGGGYRPQSVVAGFLAAENLRFLAEEEGIHVCQGTIWSQFGIDNGDGDGSVCYPYYPSQEHYCKPAQGPADFIDCVCLDGWSCDFLAARRLGFAEGHNSRLGLGPIETILRLGVETGLREQVFTTGLHFDDGFERNGFGWATVIWEVSIGGTQHLPAYGAEVRRRWPDVRAVTEGEFGQAFRSQFPDNGKLDYRFVERGSGIDGSDANREIRWFMNRAFRLALLRDWQRGTPEQVIDFTRYDLPAAEPHALTRNWSLLNVLNQKGTRPQDRPRPLAGLTAADQAVIRRRLPELFGG
jgi:hypothetical protein